MVHDGDKLSAGAAGSREPADAGPSGRSIHKVALGAGGGTVLEFYDFSIYGYLAVVMSPLFFPFDDPVLSLLAALAVFGTAYFMRPLGSVVFGHVGDRYGRKTALVATLLCMGLASTAMGLLPTYGQAGFLAPFLLVLVRMIQGFSAGGENGGAATFVSEVAPPSRRARYGSVIGLGGNIGFASAAAMAALMTVVTTDEQMQSWGWRIPFLLSLPLTLLCLWIRRTLQDSLASVTDGAVDESPLRAVFRDERRSLLRLAGLSIAVNGTSYFGFTYLSIHLTKTDGYDTVPVYWIAVGVIALTGLLMLLTGILADRIGTRAVGCIGLVGYLILTYPAMTLLDGGLGWAALGFFLIMVNTSFLQVAVFTMAPRLFAARHRYTGVAVGYNIGVMIAGGTAPFVSVALAEGTGHALAPAFFVLGVALLGLFTMVLTPRKALVADDAYAVAPIPRARDHASCGDLLEE
ncbi:MFS transporter [Rhodococcus sp. T2V]|uniref:MFS transporter n=1 Tax=Rhodococcus sp. T2V TaxID=3034164 RepID=UPI0023E21045|nr:MFS transporter [Rhodococcus sp. T2V]MDF3306214.1 MFS transporter [Rhodococcus sp. T2V]